MWKSRFFSYVREVFLVAKKWRGYFGIITTGSVANLKIPPVVIVPKNQSFLHLKQKVLKWTKFHVFSHSKNGGIFVGELGVLEY